MKKIVIPVAVFGLVFATVYFLSASSRDSNSDVGDQTSHKPLTATSDTSEFQSLLKISDVIDRDRRLEQFFTRQMQNNQSHALMAIGQLPSTKLRQDSYKIALKVWSKQDPIAFRHWLEINAPNPDLDPALLYLLEAGSPDLELVLLYAEKVFDERVRNTKLGLLIAEWSLIKTEQTILWALAIDKDRDDWLALSFERLTLDSLTKAVMSLSILESGSPDQIHLAIQTIIDNYKLGFGDIESLAAMESLIPYEIREELIGAMLPILILEEELTLADLDTLLSSLLPGGIKDSYHEQVSLSWAQRDPREAASYAETLTGETRDLAVNAVVSSWMHNDLESTDAWLRTLEGNLDLAANTLGRGSASLGNIEIADTWLNQIENGDMRTEAITDVIRGWYDEDPKSGIYHLVYQENLSKQQKLNLLHEIYPGEVFISPNEALDNIGRLEGLRPVL